MLNFKVPANLLKTFFFSLHKWFDHLVASRASVTHTHTHTHTHTPKQKKIAKHGKGLIWQLGSRVVPKLPSTFPFFKIFALFINLKQTHHQVIMLASFSRSPHTKNSRKDPPVWEIWGKASKGRSSVYVRTTVVIISDGKPKRERVLGSNGGGSYFLAFISQVSRKRKKVMGIIARNSPHARFRQRTRTSTRGARITHPCLEQGAKNARFSPKKLIFPFWSPCHTTIHHEISSREKAAERFWKTHAQTYFDPSVPHLIMDDLEESSSVWGVYYTPSSLGSWFVRESPSNPKDGTIRPVEVGRHVSTGMCDQ